MSVWFQYLVLGLGPLKLVICFFAHVKSLVVELTLPSIPLAVL